jgi:hypothetical protein
MRRASGRTLGHPFPPANRARGRSIESRHIGDVPLYVFVQDGERRFVVTSVELVERPLRTISPFSSDIARSISRGEALSYSDRPAASRASSLDSYRRKRTTFDSFSS